MIYDSKGEYIFPLKFLILLYAKLKITLTKLLLTKNNKVKVKVLNHDMYVRSDDKGLSESIIFRGIREPIATKTFIEDIEDGMTFLEIGANLGYYLLIELLYLKNSKVIAFEPNRENTVCLKENIKLHKVKGRVKLYDYAVGDKNSNLKFYISEESNAGSLVPKKDYTKTVNVKTVKLDDFLKQKIDYVRMDTEGYEIKIIKGMKKILTSKASPKKLFIEVHPEPLKEMGSSITKFYNLLKSYGYMGRKFIYQSSDYCSGKSKLAVYDNEKMFLKNPNYNKRPVIIFFEKK